MRLFWFGSKSKPISLGDEFRLILERRQAWIVTSSHHNRNGSFGSDNNWHGNLCYVSWPRYYLAEVQSVQLVAVKNVNRLSFEATIERSGCARHPLRSINLFETLSEV